MSRHTLKRKVLKLNIKDQIGASAFLIPSICGFLVFFLVPFLWGFYYTVVDSPINGNFVGLDNFKGLMSNSIFLRAASNTALFTAISVPLNMLLSLLLALALNKVSRSGSILRTLFISPLVVPVASVAFFWQLVFDFRGPLNSFLNLLGIGSVDWMKTGWARVVVVIIYLWKNMGFNIVIYLAALSNIPGDYYEAAGIDGAGRMQKFRHITLVYLIPTLFFVFITSIINSFKVFREVYLISGDYPDDSIYMLQHYMNNMFASLDYQKLTSASYIMAAVVFILVFVLFIVQKKISSRLTQ